MKELTIENLTEFLKENLKITVCMDTHSVEYDGVYNVITVNLFLGEEKISESKDEFRRD